MLFRSEEYATGNPLAYKYTSFCIKYGEFAKCQQRSMRQTLMATSNSPTCGQSNSPGQDGRIMSRRPR